MRAILALLLGVIAVADGMYFLANALYIPSPGGLGATGVALS